MACAPTTSEWSSRKVHGWASKSFYLTCLKEPLQSAASKTCYDSSFAVKAGMLWNTLPKAVNTQGTLERFKSSLGQFLDTIPDKPPTPGYSAENRNSIIDWCNQRGGPQTA